jgi:hypothetical protein
MSSISAVPPNSYSPNASQLKPLVVKPELKTPPVPPVIKDADGDNDGSKGGELTFVLNR